MPALTLHAPRSLIASIGYDPHYSRSRPCPPSITRSLAMASRRDAVIKGQEEQVLKRRWWPDDLRTAGSPSKSSMHPSGAVRFILELSSHLDPVAAAAETDRETGAKLSASVAVVLRLVSPEGQPLGKDLSGRIIDAVAMQQQQQQKQGSARSGETARSIPEDLIQKIFSGRSKARQRDDIAIELLYISRTVVGKDGSRDARRWSGQIAFPVTGCTSYGPSFLARLTDHDDFVCRAASARVMKRAWRLLVVSVERR